MFILIFLYLSGCTLTQLFYVFRFFVCLLCFFSFFLIIRFYLIIYIDISDISTRWLGGLLVERRTSVSQIRGSIPRQVAAV